MEDEVIYDDDANIITELDVPAHLVNRLRRYEIITDTRLMGIQWGKVK